MGSQRVKQDWVTELNYSHNYFPSGSEGKESACNAGAWVQSLGWEDPLEKRMATHSSILAWRILRTQEPGGLQRMGWQSVGHNWVTNTHYLTALPDSSVFINLIGKVVFLKCQCLCLEGEYVKTVLGKTNVPFKCQIFVRNKPS